MFAQSFIQPLESRLFLSASGNAAVFDMAVQMDRLQVHEDLLKFRLDCVAGTIKMLTDVATIKADDPAQAATVGPLVKQFKTDLHSMWAALLADRLTESANVLADESVIVGDFKQILADKGNATALKADHAKLLADRVTLQNACIAGLDARIATRQEYYNTINNDGQNIITAVEGDKNESPALQAAITKWVNDRTAIMTTLTADLQTLVTDRTKLAADLTAEQST